VRTDPSPSFRLTGLYPPCLFLSCLFLPCLFLPGFFLRGFFLLPGACVATLCFPTLHFPILHSPSVRFPLLRLPISSVARSSLHGCTCHTPREGVAPSIDKRPKRPRPQSRSTEIDKTTSATACNTDKAPGREAIPLISLIDKAQEIGQKNQQIRKSAESRRRHLEMTETSQTPEHANTRLAPKSAPITRSGDGVGSRQIGGHRRLETGSSVDESSPSLRKGRRPPAGSPSNPAPIDLQAPQVACGVERANKHGTSRQPPVP